jgi:hypothetical protein
MIWWRNVNKRGRLEFLDIRESLRLKWALVRVEHVVVLVRTIRKFCGSVNCGSFLENLVTQQSFETVSAVNTGSCSK